MVERTPAERLAEVIRKLVTSESANGTGVRALYDTVIGAAEKPLVEAVMDQAHWNQTEAARLLGISRNTLRKVMRQHGIPLHRAAI